MFLQKISIIIPARNEEKTIGEVINRCQQYSDDIVVIDGHSIDRTQEVARSTGARVFLDAQKGKGEAVRRGIAEAKNNILVFIDADGSHEPADIPSLVAPIEEDQAELVIASRGRGGSDELHGDLEKFIRRLGSDIITLGINYRFGVKLTDSQNGFRAIKKSVAQTLNLKENLNTIEQEMLIKVLKKRFRVKEVASHEYRRKFGSSSIQLKKNWWRYLFSWLKYLFFD